MLQNHQMLKNIKDISKHRHYLFDAFFTGYLEDIKAKNQKHLYIFDKYQEKTNELNELIEVKEFLKVVEK
jgi:hypothetical protein